MIARLQHWVELCEEAVVKGFRLLGVPPPLPPAELAYAVATFYLGVNLLTHLDESRRIDAIFGRLDELAPVVARALAP
jgi:hypothetical protein